MEEICSLLQQTYNTNISLPPNYEEIFKKYSKKLLKYCKEKHIGNTTLINLYYNKFYKHKPISLNIQGPQSLALYYAEAGSKYIYIFGENHSKFTSCKKDSILIQDYLKKLTDNTDVFIDLYLEIPPIHTYYNGLQTDKIQYKYSDCIYNTVNKGEHCDLVRVHYTDIRKEKNFTNINDISWFRSEYKKKDIEVIIQEDRFKNMVSKILTDYDDFWQKQLSSHKLLMKEIKKSYLGEEIQQFITKKLFEYTNKWKKSIINSLINKKYSSFYKLTIEPNSMIVDGYLLSRIFKKFCKDKNAPISPSNIIIYIGYNHVINISEFLKINNFTLIENTEYKEEYCVDMSTINQPLFSYNF